jgi:subtilisin family serine protease
MFKRSWDFPAGNPGRYGDNPRHPFNVIVGSLAAAGADILFAAGNCGPTCPDGRCDVPVPPIFLANSHPDGTCVAGVDTAGAVVGYSSIGPGIQGNNKPDLAAYTHFRGSEAFGPGSPDSGTSAACPVLAGVVAAFRSVYPFDPTLPKRTPSSIRQFLVNSASGAGAWKADVGYGIVDTSAFPKAGTFV